MLDTMAVSTELRPAQRLPEIDRSCSRGGHASRPPSPRRATLEHFLIETVRISASGGLVGILVGFGMAHGINLFAGWETARSPLATATAFGISALVGIVFGIYPARRAARMDPIGALRFE